MGIFAPHRRCSDEADHRKPHIKYQPTDPKGAALCVSAGLVTGIDTDATHHHQSQEIIEKQKSTTTSSIHVRVCPLAEEIMF